MPLAPREQYLEKLRRALSEKYAESKAILERRKVELLRQLEEELRGERDRIVEKARRIFGSR
ncbi:MAG: hypothetical protein QXU97_02170 [Fervidicoccaceae archaeon]